MRYKKMINILNISVMFCCQAFVFSACGNTETNSVPKADVESEAGLDTEAEEVIVKKEDDKTAYTLFSTVGDVMNDPYFEDFGYLLFPVDRSVSEDMTLEEVSSRGVYVWYNYIDPDKTVEIIQNLHDRAAAGERVFYDIYSEQEKEKLTRPGRILAYFSSKEIRVKNLQW